MPDYSKDRLLKGVRLVNNPMTVGIESREAEHSQSTFHSLSPDASGT